MPSTDFFSCGRGVDPWSSWWTSACTRISWIHITSGFLNSQWTRGDYLTSHLFKMSTGFIWLKVIKFCFQFVFCFYIVKYCIIISQNDFFYLSYFHLLICTNFSLSFTLLCQEKIFSTYLTSWLKNTLDSQAFSISWNR